jgi:hypothetical protein
MILGRNGRSGHVFSFGTFGQLPETEVANKQWTLLVYSYLPTLSWQGDCSGYGCVRFVVSVERDVTRLTRPLKALHYYLVTACQQFGECRTGRRRTNATKSR